MTAAIRRRYVPSDELVSAMSVSTMGAGPDVVLVPGLAVSNYLVPAQRALAADARVHLLDLPGVGAAADASGPLTLREDAAAVTGWLRLCLQSPAIVVGHSYGTQVVMRAAAADGRFVRAVVLASPTVDPVARSARQLLLRWRRDTNTHQRELVRVNRPQQRRAGLARITAMAVSMLADIPERWLAQIDAPVSVLVGTADAFGTQEWGQALADRTHGRFFRVEGGTHTFPFERPDPLVAAVEHIHQKG